MLALALILDAVLGEPSWLWRRVPHPVVAIGGVIRALETALNRGGARVARGALAMALLMGMVLPVPVMIWLWEYGWPLEVLGAAILLAQRSLVEHVRAVDEGLLQGLEAGRAAVSRIVGRDPAHLEDSGVARAAIESAAENFSDGVVAPAFWFALLGLPGIVAYKAVNTADSMIGYRTERYLAFGRIAARADDVMNWIPARLTGVLFCVARGGFRAFRVMVRDAGQHRSPNAGWPEAAMAASLDVALAGPRVYPTHRVEDAFMHPEGRAAARTDIDPALGTLWRAWTILLALSLVPLIF